jgi:ubiquinone/menaquinone biosynthesis C-methylase UbiE
MNSEYFLAGEKEIDRLQMQAKVWEADAEIMLDEIGVSKGWSCIDLGCGAIGILGLLARRVGVEGRIVGVDSNNSHLEVARSYLDKEKMDFVELKQADVNSSFYPAKSFDLVHSRFLLPHVSDTKKLLTNMIELVKPGGIIALEESDHSSWKFWPNCPDWDRLIEICENTFAIKSDLNMGRKIFSLLRGAGLENVKVRASVKALQDSHPYMKMILTGADAIRERAVKADITTKKEFDKIIKSVGEWISNPDNIQITFTLIQSWGEKQTQFRTGEPGH